MPSERAPPAHLEMAGPQQATGGEIVLRCGQPSRNRAKGWTIVPVTVRPASDGDVQEICEILAEGDRDHASALPTVFMTACDPAWREPAVRQWIGDPTSAVLVADEGGRLAGVVVAVLRHAPREVPVLAPRRYVWIDSLAVCSSRRRQGVGRALMEAVHRWALDQGVDEIELNVWEFNRAAIALYTSLGYATTSRRLHLRLPSA
ncbi:GNAT family N-acetyltransferase [Thermaerobacter sp. FW80]|uniref:GNAT family N-acetyltransferase n=1 Tax=Thermaerobacter sp. FW80 TaxID=2546351 RepID=UPI001074A935|nr:GNAT family N-acetyltransferase [Thermaerobacter sp. FW80]QBS38282.1 GNAT family N-acetyltransferase [Thermaerobacter sp. FW80]